MKTCHMHCIIEITSQESSRNISVWSMQPDSLSGQLHKCSEPQTKGLVTIKCINCSYMYYTVPLLLHLFPGRWQTVGWSSHWCIHKSCQLWPGQVLTFQPNLNKNYVWVWSKVSEKYAIFSSLKIALRPPPSVYLLSRFFRNINNSSITISVQCKNLLQWKILPTPLPYFYFSADRRHFNLEPTPLQNFHFHLFPFHLSLLWSKIK